MVMEGSYSIKDPCYSDKLVNPDDPKCIKGSPWSEYAQKKMAGDLGKNIEVKTSDNFHRVYTMTPVHLPQINSQCDGSSKCTVDTYSVTENFYSRLEPFDTGLQPVAALEMKAKLMSRQSMRKAAGQKDADFHESDEVGQRCAEINQDALDWALKHASQEAV